MAEVKLFEVNLNETINNIKRLEEELKSIKTIYKEAAIGSDEFYRAQAAGKELTAELKKQNDALKANTNALGGINSAAKFAEGTYGRLKQQIKENKDMLDKVTIGGKVYNGLIAEQNRLQQERIKIEMSMPSLFQERIKGAIDQSKAISGLNMSMMQLTREMPAFANSVQTGFMAISNNLPMFFDSIKRIKDENKELASQGKATTSVFKSIVGSLTSVGSLLSIGVTLLTVYGAKLVESVVALMDQENALQLNKEATEAYNKGIEDSNKAISDLINKIGDLVTKQLELNGTLQKEQVTVLKSLEDYSKEYDKIEENRIKKAREIILKQYKGQLEDLIEQGATEQEQLDYLQKEKLIQLNKAGTDIIATNTRFGKESLSVEEDLIRQRLQANNKGFDAQQKLLEQSYNEQQKVNYQEHQNDLNDKDKNGKEKNKKVAKIADDEIKILEAAIQRKKNLNQDSMHEEIALEKYKLNQILKDTTKTNGDRLKTQAEYFRNVGKIQKESIDRNIKEEKALLEANIKEAQLERGESFEETRKAIQYAHEIELQNQALSYEELKLLKLKHQEELREIDQAEEDYIETQRQRQLERQRNYLKIVQEDKLIQAETLKNIDEVNYQDELDNLNEQFELKQEALLLQRDQELLGVEEFSQSYNNIIAKYKNEEVKLFQQAEEEKRKLREQEIKSTFDTMQVITNLGALLAQNKEQQDAFMKMSSLATVAMNTGIAISNLVATSFSPLSPDNIATGGIAAYAKLATGLVAVTANMLQAQQIINSFEEGGYTGEGNPHEVSTNLGSKSYTYHKDEYVIPSRVLNTPKGSALAGQLENMRLGMSNPMPHISGMFDGGFTGRSAGMETTNMLQNQIMMQKFIESMPNPVVRVTDINRTQGSVQRAVNVSSL